MTNLQYQYQLSQELSNFLHHILAADFHGSLSNSLYENCAILASSLPAELKDKLLNRLGTQDYFHRLLMSQSEDGSWREDTRIFYLPDALISTTSVLLVILTNNLIPIDHQIVQKAVSFISKHLLKALTVDEMKKTIAFEPILIAHINRLIELGLTFGLEQDVFHQLNLKRNTMLEHKLAHLYDANATIHSILDAFSDKAKQIDWQRLSSWQEANGSMGIYISSTIQLLENIDVNTLAYQKGLDYLTCCINETNGPTAFAPSDTFEIWWSLYLLCGSPLSYEIRDTLASIDFNIPQIGVAVTNNFSLPDVDTTAMKIATLRFLGKLVDIKPIMNFYNGQAYQCYHYENRLSPSANIHALMALVNAVESMLQIPPEVYEQLVSSLNYLLAQLQPDHFHDKWHLSNLYTTCHAVELFTVLLSSNVFRTLPSPVMQMVSERVILMIRYILDKHNSDGGFGEFIDSTVEETSYAVSALIKASKALDMDFEQEIFASSQSFLLTHTPDTDIPLWLGKTLYKSWAITQAAKLSALAWIDDYLN